MEKRKNFLIGTLLVAIVAMAVGYAALAQTLNINGTGKIDARWDVSFTGITSTFTGTASNSRDESDQEIIPTASGTTATFSVDLKKPGDKGTYIITIKNQGTIDAVLKSITDLATTNANNPSEIQFTITGANVNDVLAAGATTTVTVTAEWVGDTVPATSVSKTAVINLVYEQA